MITITVRGLEELGAKLERIAGGIKPASEKAMLKAVIYVQGKIPKYPAPPEGSKYRRTGTLGRSVTAMRGQQPGALARVETIGGEIRGWVGSNITYAPWVIDRQYQAAQHKGRWYVLQDVVEKAREGIRKIFEREIHDLVTK